MRVDEFDFELPEERVAQVALEPRDSAKMLVVKHGTLEDSIVSDITAYLKPGDILVFNDTRVIPARLFGKRGEAAIEIFLHKSIYQGAWEALAKPAKKLKIGDDICFSDDFSARFTAKRDDGFVELLFRESDEELLAKIKRYGVTPLPPYIKRDKEQHAEDEARYQTVYAKHDGSVAAPTAGLHFTQDLLERIRVMGVHVAYVTLHVGAGTFLPMKVEDTAEHVMHKERAVVSKATADAINLVRKNGGRVIAVGTTSMRTLESAADENGMLHPFDSDTGIFITPGYRFKICDLLMTNFHLPKSTLFMLVSAFSGLETMKAAYAYAIENNYRFYSYGDASLLYKAA
jgi:S-adenosylmethionine:tRNA ribosyltransferase-isomerase